MKLHSTAICHFSRISDNSKSLNCPVIFEIARFNCTFTGIKVTNNDNVTHSVLVATRIYLLLEGLCNSCIHVFNGDFQRLILRMKTNVSILNNVNSKLRHTYASLLLSRWSFLSPTWKKIWAKWVYAS